MKRFLSTNYSAGGFNTGILLIRLVFGLFMLLHGYDKLVHFQDSLGGFEKMLGSSFMGMSPKVNLILCIFAEFFCSILIILGLFTRLACIPLIITMCVVIFKVNNGNLEHSETAVLYLVSYFLLLFVGAGKASVDGLISK